MPLGRESHRIVIAGASTLLGIELKSLLEESRFAASEFVLVDEEIAAGTLTEAGGEPAVIQVVQKDTFERAQFVFFTGSAQFTIANLPLARKSGAKVIDLSGATAGLPGTVGWFPRIDVLSGGEFQPDAAQFLVPSAPATAASALSLGLNAIGLRSLVYIAFQPVSEAGRIGVEELESQTSQLLSFQSVGKPVFDTQVGFAMLDRFGPGSSQQLRSARERVRAEASLCLAGKAPAPAIQVLHVPVFYGTTFTAYSELNPTADAQAISDLCKQAGFSVSDEGEGPSNVSATGEGVIQLARPEPDGTQKGAWWFWGAADNIRLPAANAVKLAELLS
jgi:aspartate-semialdehyde dehydrogenase